MRDEFQVSVVIPTYNRGKVLAHAIQSVIEQTLKVNEIIIVDDGSTDDTINGLEPFRSQIRLLTQTNQGVSCARNAGIQAAKNQWIAFLDSDDRWLPKKLERQYLAMQKKPGHFICHTDEVWIRNGVRVNPMKKHRKYGGDIFEKCLPLCVVSPSSALLKKSLLDEIGLFDETLPACEDYDMWLRISARYPVLFVDEPLIVKYGGHSDQLSKRYWAMDRFRVQALVQLVESNCLDEYKQHQAIGMLNKKCHILRQGAEKRNNHELVDRYNAISEKYAVTNYG